MDGGGAVCVLHRKGIRMFDVVFDVVFTSRNGYGNDTWRVNKPCVNKPRSGTVHARRRVKEPNVFRDVGGRLFSLERG